MLQNEECIKMHGDFEHDNFVLKEDDYGSVQTVQEGILHMQNWYWLRLLI